MCVIYRNATVVGKASISSHDARNLPRSETGRLSEGSESPATTIYDVKPVDKLQMSSHSGGDTKTEVTLPSSVGEGAVDALHKIMVDEEYVTSMPNENENVTPQPIADSSSSKIGTRSRTYWQPPMDRYFIDLMLEEVQKGNQIDGQFHKQAWMEMLVSFNAKFGFKYDIDILKNRYKTLRRQYKVIKNILDLDGFSWDERRQMVTADDSVWQDYLKVWFLLNLVVSYTPMNLRNTVSALQAAYYMFSDYFQC